MWNLSDSIQGVKNALFQALQSIPEFCQLNAADKGKVVDANFKSMLTDLMSQFGLTPGKDYKADLRTNEPSSDFVICSKEANDLIRDLLNGKIIVVREHSRMNRSGASSVVKAHFRRR